MGTEGLLWNRLEANTGLPIRNWRQNVGHTPNQCCHKALCGAGGSGWGFRALGTLRGQPG